MADLRATIRGDNLKHEAFALVMANRRDYSDGGAAQNFSNALNYLT